MRRGVPAGDSVACVLRSTRTAHLEGREDLGRWRWFVGCKRALRHTPGEIVVNRTAPPASLLVASFGALALSVLSGPTLAHAETPDLPLRPRSLDPRPFEQAPSATTWGIAGYHLGLGLGARMTLPAADGLLHTSRISDVFAVDVGADYLRFHDDATSSALATTTGSILRPVAGLLWAFRFGHRLALYPKLELGWNVPRIDQRDPDLTAHYAGMHVEGIAGLLLSLGSLSLRAESGWGYLKAGIAFAI
jgi:hypothetical protein